MLVMLVCRLWHTPVEIIDINNRILMSGKPEKKKAPKPGAGQGKTAAAEAHRKATEEKEKAKAKEEEEKAKKTVEAKAAATAAEKEAREAREKALRKLARQGTTMSGRVNHGKIRNKGANANNKAQVWKNAGGGRTRRKRRN